MSIDPWVATLDGYLSDIEVTGFHIEGSAIGHTRIVLDDIPPPPGVTLVIRDVGSGTTECTVALRTGIAPDSLELELHQHLKKLFIEDPEAGFNRLMISGPVGGLQVGPIALEARSGTPGLPDNLVLDDGYFNVNPQHAPTHLFLQGASVTTNSAGTYDILEVSGTCALPEGTSVAQLRIHPGSELTLPNMTINDFVSATSGHLRFSFKGTLSSALPPNTEVDLRDSASLVVTSRVTNLSISGNGTVTVNRELIDSSFNPSDAFSLTLDVSGSAEGVTGDVSLKADDGAVVIGADGDPIRLRQIVSLGRAEVENVSLYSLDSLANLSELKNLARFSMWLGSKKEAKDLSDKMQLGGGSETTMKKKRAHFWASLADVLKDSHATGRVQSAARHNAMHFRREHLERGTERNLLSLYKAVGYGESIRRPLLAIPTLCAAITPWLMQPDILGAGDWWTRCSEYANTYFALLLAPLAFFKSPIEAPESVHGPLETFLLVGFQLLSLLLLFFSLSAIRRITKAE